MNHVQLENPNQELLLILDQLVHYLESVQDWTIREELILFETNQLLRRIFPGLREDGATSLARRLLKLGTRFNLKKEGELENDED
jgi:hypothetical protein